MRFVAPIVLQNHDGNVTLLTPPTPELNGLATLDTDTAGHKASLQDTADQPRGVHAAHEQT